MGRLLLENSTGIELAKQFNGEIISGDSQQVYRQLDIGTAKATPEEQAEAVHHLIDVRNVDETYSVYDFVQKLAQPFQRLSVVANFRLSSGNRTLSSKLTRRLPFGWSSRSGKGSYLSKRA